MEKREELNELLKPVFDRPETYSSEKTLETLRKYLIEMTAKFSAYSNARLSGKINQWQHIDEQQTIKELNEALNILEDSREELSKHGYQF